MLKKTISYEDYDGNKRTEDFYFNISKAELTKMQFSSNGGLDKVLTRMVQEQDSAKIVGLLEDIILMAYGIKSDDGKHFQKSKEISDNFKQTEAFSVLFMELASDADAASNFFKGIIPADLAAQLPKDVKKLPQ